jgi:hypothetical protein
LFELLHFVSEGLIWETIYIGQGAIFLFEGHFSLDLSSPGIKLSQAFEFWFSEILPELAPKLIFPVFFYIKSRTIQRWINTTGLSSFLNLSIHPFRYLCRSGCLRRDTSLLLIISGRRILLSLLEVDIRIIKPSSVSIVRMHKLLWLNWL